MPTSDRDRPANGSVSGSNNSSSNGNTRPIAARNKPLQVGTVRSGNVAPTAVRNAPSKRTSRSVRHPRPEVDARIRQLDAERDPLSLPEEIVSEASKAGTNVGIPTETDDQSITIADLQKSPVSRLIQMASDDGLTDYAGLSRQELIFQLLKHRMKKNGLMYGEGTLEILPDGFGFLRSAEYHYLSCPDDIYVSPSQIRRFGLRTGSHVAGQIRPPKENERYFALLRIEAINGQPPGRDKVAVPFDELTPLPPNQQVRLEHVGGDASARVIDLVAPIGRGSRGLIVAPPETGKTRLIQSIAAGVRANHPDTRVFVLLIDERPEEVTMIERTVQNEHCEVISSTFDEPPSRHIQVAQMVIEKARRMVENATDVVILMDSITRLVRAHIADGQDGASPAGSETAAMQQAKSLFSSARRIEEGGSLTILTVAEVDSGDPLEANVQRELRTSSNLQITLSDDLSSRRVWPAIDIFRSSTRREEMIVDADQFVGITNLRQQLGDETPRSAMKRLLQQIGATADNAGLLSGGQTN